jgi:hypothetical protein
MSAIGGKADIDLPPRKSADDPKRTLALRPSHFAPQIQQHTRPQRQRDQNASCYVIESMHGIAPATPASSIRRAGVFSCTRAYPPVPRPIRKRGEQPHIERHDHIDQSQPRANLSKLKATRPVYGQVAPRHWTPHPRA